MSPSDEISFSLASGLAVVLFPLPRKKRKRTRSQVRTPNYWATVIITGLNRGSTPTCIPSIRCSSSTEWISLLKQTTITLTITAEGCSVYRNGYVGESHLGLCGSQCATGIQTLKLCPLLPRGPSPEIYRLSALCLMKDHVVFLPRAYSVALSGRRLQWWVVLSGEQRMD